MSISWIAKLDSSKNIVAPSSCVADGVTPEQAALAMGLGEENINWRVITGDEAATLQAPPPEEQQTAMQKTFTDAVQAHLDAFSQTRNYDGILSAATYATSTMPQFRTEGQYAVEARDATWAKGYEILGEVLSGQRPMPTIEEVIAELPPLKWPEVVS
jgi:hypothetical protein